MFVCCECCVLSGRGLCDELITRPEESTGCLYVRVCVRECECTCHNVSVTKRATVCECECAYVCGCECACQNV